MLPKYMNTISTLEIADMISKKHYKILERIHGTKDNKTMGLLEIIKKQNLDTKKYFIESSYKDKKNQSRICYDCTLDGVKMYIDYTRNYRDKEPLLSWYNKNSNTNQNIILCDRKEKYFIDELNEVLNVMNIKCIRQFRVLKYYVDLFIPDFNLVIEYDEGDHKDYAYENQELRQINIEKEIGCKFIKLSDFDSNLHNIGIVMNEICNVNHF